jgi:hypothetical protein
LRNKKKIEIPSDKTSGVSLGQTTSTRQFGSTTTCTDQQERSTEVDLRIDTETDIKIDMMTGLENYTTLDSVVLRK